MKRLAVFIPLLLLVLGAAPGKPYPLKLNVMASDDATLGECLDRWLCLRVPELRYEVIDGRNLIDLKEKKP